MCPSSCVPLWRRCHQIPHVTVGERVQFLCSKSGLMTLHETVSVQVILRSFPLVTLWISISSLPVGETLRTNTGQPQVWYFVGNIWNSTFTNFWFGFFPSFSISRMLYLLHASFDDNGHIMVITASGHIIVECRKSLRLPMVNSLILHSKIVFWW